MNNNRILDCKNQEWDIYIEKVLGKKKDIYYVRQYYCLEEEQGHGMGRLFVYEDNKGNIGIYPFLLHSIQSDIVQGEYYDIETAYGYGGPIINAKDEFFRVEFEREFLEYCKSNHIIAEFIRFHPLIQNQDIFKKNISVLENRTTVWLDLQKTEHEIWMEEISTQNRNIIRKCIKNGLKVEISDDYEEFIEIYNATMDKVGADTFYYFKDSYYKSISENKEYTLLKVIYKEESIAAAIFIGCGCYFHYHLAGSKKEFLKLAPNNLLLWEAIKYGKEKGYEKMHFGGGLTNSSEDTLFRFKKKFSSTVATFYIGKRIHNQTIYNQLIADWERIHNQKAKLLLQYRE